MCLIICSEREDKCISRTIKHDLIITAPKKKSIVIKKNKNECVREQSEIGAGEVGRIAHPEEDEPTSCFPYPAGWGGGTNWLCFYFCNISPSHSSLQR